MAKLSAQLKASKVTPSKFTRTERVLAQQRKKGRIKEFKKKKKKAEKVREQKLSNVSTIKDYKEVYKGIDTELKPFFRKPKTLEAEKEAKISAVTTKVEKEIEQAKKEQEQVDRYLDAENKQRKERRKYWKEKKDEGSITNKEYKERVEDIENKFDEERDESEEETAYWKAYKKGLKEGKKKLESGKYFKYQNIREYADDLGDIEQEEEEAWNEKREIERKYQKALKETPYKMVDEMKVYTESPEIFEKHAEMEGLRVTKTKIPRIEKSVIFRDYARKPKVKTLEETGVKRLKDVKMTDVTPQKVYIPPQKRFVTVKGFQGERIITREQLEKERKQQEKRKKGTIFSAITEAYKKIPSGTLYYNPPSLKTAIAPFLTLSPVKLSKKSFTMKEATENVQKDITKLQKKFIDVSLGKKEQKEIKEKITTEYEKDVQQTFLGEYEEKIREGEITFEEAKKKFKKSEEAKELEKIYGEKYGEEFEKLSAKQPLYEKALYGGTVAGLGLGKSAVGIVKTPKSAVTGGAVIYGTLTGLRMIPSKVITGGLAVQTGEGIYKFTKPSSTLEEAGAGFLQAGISGGLLGYTGYKHLRKPMIKTKPIGRDFYKAQKLKGISKPPKIYPKLTKQVTTFPRQRYSVQAFAGRRTVVTTKGRQLLKKVGIKTAPIYKGVPYGHLKSYRKALKKLTKYKVPKTKARKILRYKAPRIEKTGIRGKTVLYKPEGVKPYAYSVTDISKTYPKKVISKKLGIKTRAGKPVQERVISTKKLLGKYRGYDVVREASFKGRITPEGLVKPKGALRILYTKTGKIKTIPLRYRKGMTQKEFLRQIETSGAYKPKGYGVLREKAVGYRDITGRMKEITAKSIREGSLGKARIVVSPKKAERVSKVLGTKKPPTFRAFVRDEGKFIKLPATAKRVTKPTTIREQKLLKSLQSKLAPAQRITKTQEVALKSLTPPTKVKALRTVSKTIPSKISMSTTATATALAQTIAPTTKFTPKKIQRSKLVNLIKSISKEKTRTGEVADVDAQARKKAESEALKQKVRTISSPRKVTKTPTITETPPIAVAPRVPKAPKIPKGMPSVKAFPFWMKFPYGYKRKKAKVSKKELYQRAYLPDFTAKALGLKPETVTPLQARKKLRKTFTGMEIRRAVKLRKF